MEESESDDHVMQNLGLLQFFYNIVHVNILFSIDVVYIRCLHVLIELNSYVVGYSFNSLLHLALNVSV